MEIVQIISEHKKIRVGTFGRKVTAVKPGHKRVMAIVNENGRKVTRHVDIQK